MLCRLPSRAGSLPGAKHGKLIGTTGTLGQPISSAFPCEDPDDRVRRDDSFGAPEEIEPKTSSSDLDFRRIETAIHDILPAKL